MCDLCDMCDTGLGHVDDTSASSAYACAISTIHAMLNENHTMMHSKQAREKLVGHFARPLPPIM